jgi:hypothetical protein
LFYPSIKELWDKSTKIGHVYFSRPHDDLLRRAGFTEGDSVVSWAEHWQDEPSSCDSKSANGLINSTGQRLVKACRICTLKNPLPKSANCSSSLIKVMLNNQMG